MVICQPSSCGRPALKIDELSKRWNEPGRTYRQDLCSQISDYHANRIEEVKDCDDPRDEDLAGAVLAQVREFNEEGAWRKARQHFDPAWEPFVNRLDKNGRSLDCATILGEDDYLLRLGSEYEDAELVRIRGERVVPVAQAMACAMSRNRKFLVMADRARGLVVTDGFPGTLLAEAPWPDPEDRLPHGLPAKLRSDWSRFEGAPQVVDLRICNHGKRILVISSEEGVLLCDLSRAEPAWRLLLPDYGWASNPDFEEDEPPYFESVDMVHGDLSPDGNLAAFGLQHTKHFVATLREDGVEPFARVGQYSEYPHFALFSDDGRFLAFNSCHFYNGITGVLEVATARGLETPSWEEDPRFPVVENSLRVYGATWLPPGATEEATGAFCLAGAGWLKCVTPGGELLWEHLFGSTASSLDYCPKSNTLLLGSYSGFLHVLDPGAEAEAGTEIGYRPRRERKRWVFWREEKTPLQW